MKGILTAFLVLSSVIPAGCDDDDPVSSTGEIVIQLSGIKEGDIVSGVVEKSKNVTTESGNPYGAFLTDARAALGGDPGRIEVTSARITLAEGSRGIAAFEALFDGDVDVFLSADVGGTVPVARVHAPTGSGPVTCEVVAGSSDLAPILAALRSGSFRVGIRGHTPRLETDDFDARVDVRIGFAAYE
jgi:hypothetical protein